MGSLNRKSLPAVAAIPLIALFSFLVSQHAISANPLRIVRQASDLLGITAETDVRAPVDFGAGPGVTPTAEMKRAASTSSQVPDGGGAANVTGAFGPAVTWPIIPLHAVLLPDGRVMNYGTDQNGQQGAQLIYDIWDPSLGTDISAHTVLPNTTGTDIFCSSQSVMLSGAVLVTGGDLTVNGVRNFARNDTNIFSPTANTLTSNTPMHYARWYGSLVALPDGHLAVFGGIQNVVTLEPEQPVTTPEEYDPATQVWTTLTGADSAAAFGNNNDSSNWYYPRSYVAPGGAIFVLGVDGTMYSVSTAGVGNITTYSQTVSAGSETLPTIPFAPGKVLTVRLDKEVDVIDFSGPTPVVTQTDDIGENGVDEDTNANQRLWASGTVMADGRVLITGGSEVANVLTGVAYQAQIWDPATGHWTAGASATKPRLYHSNSMLLTDATVLTGGGGAPGPVNNLNAEIYYPPYLYDGNGAAAVRPVITAATPLNLQPGGTISLTVGPADNISNLTFIRTGSATHSNNSDQRFITLPFTQTNQDVTAVLPSDPTVLLPGYYMLFAFNDAGVPSIATVVSIAAQAQGSSPVVTTTVSASPITITTGQSMTLTWNSTNASSCTASGGGASDGWAGAKATSGSFTITEASVPNPLSVSYTLTCTSATSGQSAQASATVTENPAGTSSGGGGSSSGGGGSSSGGGGASSGGGGSSSGGGGSSSGGGSSGSSAGSAPAAKSGGGGSFDLLALIFLLGVAGLRCIERGAWLTIKTPSKSLEVLRMIVARMLRGAALAQPRLCRPAACR
jgi:hypothetical protein